MASNPFYSAMTGGNGMMQMLGQLKQNPVQFLMQKRLNIPADIAGDPQAILQHLMSTGQVNQQQVNNAYQMLNRFR